MFSSICISSIGLLLPAIASSSELFSFGLPFSGLFSSGLFPTLSSESSPFSFLCFIFAIASFIPISNSLLIANISTIFTDISQISYLGFLLYFILSANKVNSAKFSAFWLSLLSNFIFFNSSNILTVSPVNVFAFVIPLNHSQNSKKLLFSDIPSGIGKHLWHDPSLVLLSIPISQSKLCFIIISIRVSLYQLVLSELSRSLLDPSVLYPSDSLLRYSP